MGLTSPSIVFLATSFKSSVPLKLKWLGFIKQAHDSVRQDTVFLSDFDICYVRLSAECYRPDYVIDLIKPLRSCPVTTGVNFEYAGYLKAAAQCFMLLKDYGSCYEASRIGYSLSSMMSKTDLAWIRCLKV